MLQQDKQAKRQTKKIARTALGGWPDIQFILFPRRAPDRTCLSTNFGSHSEPCNAHFLGSTTVLAVGEKHLASGKYIFPHYIFFPVAAAAAAGVVSFFLANIFRENVERRKRKKKQSTKMKARAKGTRVATVVFLMFPHFSAV